MKKQELIKHIEDLPYKEGLIIDKIDISRKGLLELVKQLDEPQPAQVPQVVVDWYEENKDDFETSLFQCIYEILKKRNDNELNEFEKWVIDENTEPFKTLVNMHQFGYEVEKEKEYKVVLLNYNDGHLNLVNVRTLGENIIFFTKKTQFDPRSLKLTKAEIISSGFGWVFDCPGIKIEEVE